MILAQKNEPSIQKMSSVVSQRKNNRKLDIYELIDSDIIDITEDIEDRLNRDKKADKKILSSVVFLTYVCDDTNLNSKIIFDFFYKMGFDGILVVDEYGAKPDKKKGKKDEEEMKKHHHVLLIKEKRVNIRNLTKFDICCEHPHIRVGKKTDVGKIIDYCMKQRRGRPVPEGLSKEITYGINVETQSERKNLCNDMNTKYLDAIVEESETYEDAKKTLCKKGVKVRDYKLALAYIKESFPAMNRYYRCNQGVCHRIDQYEYHPKLIQYFDTYIFTEKRYDRYPMLVVQGLTRRQKSTAMSMMAPHLYFRGNVDMCAFANIPPDVKYIIMDDISIDNHDHLFKNNALMLGTHDGWTEKFLYIGQQPVENPVPVIWLCNEAPEAVSKDCVKYNGKGYYYMNSWNVRINQHMAKFPHRFMGDKFREAWNSGEEFKKSVCYERDSVQAFDNEYVLDPEKVKKYFDEFGRYLDVDPMLIQEFSDYPLEELLATDEAVSIKVCSLGKREVKGVRFNQNQAMRMLESIKTGETSVIINPE